MQYHLDTIPVWESLEQTEMCPFCYLFQKCEQGEVERSLGGAVMEPEVRVRMNHTGLCARHHEQIYELQNRLGHSLLMESHIKELLPHLEKAQKKLEASSAPGGLLRKNTAVQDFLKELEAMNHSCAICEDIESHMQRYFYTFLHLWKTDASFRSRWQNSQGLCAPHTEALIRAACQHLDAGNQKKLTEEAAKLLCAKLKEDGEDLTRFISKFDYRHQNDPWGTCRDAPQRCANRLRGWCVQTEPKQK